MHKVIKLIFACGVEIAVEIHTKNVYHVFEWLNFYLHRHLNMFLFAQWKIKSYFFIRCERTVFIRQNLTYKNAPRT